MPPEASTNSQTASVNAAFDAMERQMGSRTFRDLFKSITADNGKVSKTAVRQTQDWMNTYPRKILNGLTPLVALAHQKGKGFLLPPFLKVVV